jgi:hypothetical protein
MDMDAIEPGLPFDEVINQAVGHCEILLAMVGKRWMEEQPGVGPRINDAKDFVRLEIAAALSRGIRVIPVLLDGAIMPTEEALPEPLRALARRNAIEVSNSRFNSDVNRLVDAVSKALGESDASNSEQDPPPRKAMRYWLVGGLAAVALFSSIAYVYLPTKNGRRPNPPTVAGLPTATETASGLCKKLGNNAIDLYINKYHGIIGPAGIKLQEIGHGALFRFETQVEFSDETVKEQFGRTLSDKIVGTCQDTTITLERTLGDESIQRLTGSIFKAGTGETEMKGFFESGQYEWTGRIVGPSRR